MIHTRRSPLGVRGNRLSQTLARQRRVPASGTPRWLAPTNAVVIAYLVSMLVYLPLSLGKTQFGYFEFLLGEDGTPDQSTFVGHLILLSSLGLFILGAQLANLVGLSRKPKDCKAINLTISNIYLAPLVAAFCVTVIVTLLWLGGAFGGLAPQDFAGLAVDENLTARSLATDAAFPGARLATYGLMGIIAFSAACITKVKGWGARLTLVALICTSLALLAFLPILVSGRITLIVGLIAAFVAACATSRRLVGFKYVFLAIPLLVATWTAKQVASLGETTEARDLSALSQALQSALYYFYNDTLNALNATQHIGEAYSYGWYSIRSVFFLTFTDGILVRSISSSLTDISQWLRAGEVPMLSAPLVDFGFLGFFMLPALGYFSQKMYLRAHETPPKSAQYGLIFGSLLVSMHSSFVTSQEVVYSLLLIQLLAYLGNATSLANNRSRMRHAHRSPFPR